MALFASNCAGFKDIALKPLQAWKGVSYLAMEPPEKRHHLLKLTVR